MFNGKKAKWIAKNVNAKAKKYDWKIDLGEKYGDGNWIAVFEYPWKKGNKVAYSNNSFTIVYSKSLSCDNLSVENEWPYVPSDLPNIRKVFITDESWAGDLGGVNGADEKCQKEADEKGYGGKWHAFLGGDEETAEERMGKTPKGTEGIFVIAEPSSKLNRNGGVTCHRLLGRNFNEFLSKLSNPFIIDKTKLSEKFLNSLSDIWLGRINEKSKKNCISIFSAMSNKYNKLKEEYTFTSTCQNWTKGTKFVDGYQTRESNQSFPTCYATGGRMTDAVALGGLSEGIEKNNDGFDHFTPYQGKYCNTKQKLLCIEE